MKGDDWSEKKEIILSTNVSDYGSNDTYIVVALFDSFSTWIYRKGVLVSSKWFCIALHLILHLR